MIIKKIPKEEWKEILSYRNYCRRRNACCMVLGDQTYASDRHEWLEMKLDACHFGGWDVEKDEPASPMYRELPYYKKIKAKKEKGDK